MMSWKTMSLTITSSKSKNSTAKINFLIWNSNLSSWMSDNLQVLSVSEIIFVISLSRHPLTDSEQLLGIFSSTGLGW